ncbi:hypothetical protein GH714_008359 [Hevea brasiliensis]|uniref:ABC transporter domain-containing protein n=1 Tax=Hevea brasiliensis TaxID=3981 RepID=A0A6A6N1P8_HEVBR|nr:hypothetical protein GH714_008359 [Hevea brasiliensis]
MPDMSKKKIKFSSSWSLVLWVIFAFSLLRFVQCQDVGDYNEVDNPAVLPLLTQLVYSRLSNLTAVLSREISNRSNFCVKDPEADWNQAFNFSSNLDFLATCIQKTKGDITRRICTAAEMKFYFNSFFEPSTHDNYLKPNKNCNLTSWVSGCEPGWACSVGQDQPVDLENSHNIPARSRNFHVGIENPSNANLSYLELLHYCRMGSTSEKRCFKLTSCKANSTSQNIHAYGIMLMVALTTVLLIIYNCSDQVITTRERRLAKSREAGARSARETARARQRWKVAKDAAKKHASGLQTHLSRTFSRKKYGKYPEQFKILNQDKSEMEVDLYPPSHSIADPNPTRHMPEGEQMTTHTQIFKYAYAQLEKEKAMELENKNLTFSGVVNMAINTEIKRRPLIEISFKELTLTLKAKNKHLLRGVTGKIKPGRITAVMGPSGAGKTTFLSALAGKPIGCRMTGLILINGKNQSIHSYKKIIGFVPQDDIVHGNLTVEETLVQCSLQPDKVLIVERVIESLGLQTVRDSLVGTVEKRGISGGQKKRVNVGLEMVMEPSLLILDEPTSGLDSASSQLLLKALRREALEGVNICMVVHQPSYTLFKMFDDLVLLAKGGLIVYHGPAKKVEEYFAGLGINVPERVNPPDHYIDILEGIVTPSPSSGVNYKELPIRWMLHNGYPIPPDMQRYAAGLASPVDINPADESNLGGFGMEEQSFAGELWQDMKSHVELHRDKIRHNFLKSRDLSNRRTPGVFWQYRYFLGRVGKQRLREAKIQAIDYLILLLAGVCLGSLAKVNDQTFGAAGYTYTIIAVCPAQLVSDDGSQLNDHLLLNIDFQIGHYAHIDELCFLQWSVILPVVLTLIATQSNQSNTLKNIANLCYPKWALEAFVIANAERYYGVWLITRCGSLLKTGYNLHHWVFVYSFSSSSAWLLVLWHSLVW